MILTLLASAAVAILPPVITTPKVAANPGKSALRRSNLHMRYALDAYFLETPEPDIAIHDVRFDAVRSLVRNTYRKGKTVKPVDGLTVERVEAACSAACFDFNLDGARITIRDAVLTGRGSKAYQIGAHFTGTVHDVLVERASASFFTSAEPENYPNADGFGTERGVQRITFRDASATDNTDGGFDLKSQDTVLDRTFAARNRYNYRLWGSGRGTTVVSDSPRKAHIQLAGGHYVIDRLVATGPGALVQIAKPGGSIEIKACDLTGWTGTEKISGSGASVTLGKGC